MVAYKRQKADCDYKQDTVTCLPHGLYTIKCLQNESCFGGQLSLKPRLPCKQTSETLSSQIDVCDSEPLLLLLRLTKPLLRHCINMLLNTNKHTQLVLSSPMSGTQQSHLTSNTTANIVWKVWQDPTPNPPPPSPLLLLFSPLFIFLQIRVVSPGYMIDISACKEWPTPQSIRCICQKTWQVHWYFAKPSGWPSICRS